MMPGDDPNAQAQTDVAQTAAAGAAAAQGAATQQPAAQQPPPGTAMATNIPAPEKDGGPVRSRRGAARNAPYPTLDGTVHAAVGAIEHALGTPIRVPDQDCEVDELRKYIDLKFGRIDVQLKHLEDVQHDEQLGAAQWRTRAEQSQGTADQRLNLLDGRLTSAETMAQKVQDELRQMEKYVIGMNMQTLRQKLDKFALDIEKAFSDVQQTNLDLQNHIGTISQAYGQQQEQLNAIERATGQLGKMTELHSRQVKWLNENTLDQLQRAAPRCGGLENYVSSLPAAPAASMPTPTPSGISMVQAFAPGKCHCTCVEQLMAEMVAAKNDIQGLTVNVNGLRCEMPNGLETRIRIMENSLSAQDQVPRAPSGQAPAPAQASSDPWWRSTPGMDPNGAGGPGGDGGDDFPGPNGGPGSFNRRPWMGNPQNDTKGFNLEKVFDDKVALSNDYSFDGDQGGERWRVKIRGYWISKFPALVQVLEWAEKRDNRRITDEVLELERAAAVHANRWKPILDPSTLERINGAIWGFLNTSLKGEAHRTFQLAPELNGLEGWRAVVASIHRGRENRQAELRKLIRNPPAINKLEDVERGIVNYDNLIREYEACEGIPPTKAERKDDLLDMLPAEIRENLLWRVTDSSKSYEEFRDHVRAQANHVLYHRGKLKSQINNLEQVLELTKDNLPNTNDVEELAGAIVQKGELLAAVMKRVNFRAPNGRFNTTSGAPRGPNGALDGRRCVNCGSKGHLAAKCPQAAVSPDKRPCYQCGQPGHVARNCPKSSQNGGRRVQIVDEDTVDFGGLVVEPPPTPEAGWQTSRSRVKPSVMTFGDFITPTKNSYSALSCSDGCSCEHKGNIPQAAGPNSTSQKAEENVAMPEVNKLKGNKRKKGKILRKQMVAMNEPDTLFELDTPDNHDAPLEDLLTAPMYEQEDEEVLNTEEEKEIEVAGDSGCVRHCICPEDLPGAVVVKPPPPGTRDFVGAGGDFIKRHGMAAVQTQQEGFGPVNQVLQVADVTRALHSFSQIADTEKEILITKSEATVVPAGALSKYLRYCKRLAMYGRRGGLYIGKMKIRVPRAKPADQAPFGRQGAAR